MFKKYLDFLSEALASEHSIANGRVRSQTKSQMGYNLTDTDGRFFYLHTGPKGDFKVGDHYVFTYHPSNRCEGRLDVHRYLATDTLDDFINLLWEDNEARLSLLNHYYSHPLFGTTIQNTLKDKLPTEEAEFRELLESISDQIIGKLLDDLDIAYVPWCLEHPVTEKKLCFYLLRNFDNADENDITNIRAYAEQNTLALASWLLDFLHSHKVEMDESLPELLSVFDLVSHDRECISSFLKHAWANNPKSIAVANTLFDHPSLRNSTWHWVDSQTPETGPEFEAFTSQFSHKLGTAIAEKAPLNLLPWCLHYAISEGRVCQYIAQYVSEMVPAVFDKLAHFSRKEGYLQAGFLIMLCEHHKQHRMVDISAVTLKFRALIEQLFTQNTQSRSKIDALILYPCNSGNPLHKFAISRIGTLTHCEGTYCEPRGASSEHQPAPYTFCRRKKCNVELDHEFSAAPLYSVLGKLFGIQATQLHKNEQFLRNIAALNRWNEILERLHCQGCKTPLSLSEHAKGSVGKMAYSATYWHCENKECHKYCESIKITHCYGCNKVIDSRHDSQSCNPWEVKSYRKFYICSSCASCCRGHEGFSGRCPKCGVDKAYEDVQHGDRTRAKCRQCQHQVSIDQRHFQSYHQRSQETQFSSVRRLSQANSSLVFPANLLNPGSVGLIVHDWQWDQPILYAYDLFACLNAGRLTLEQLEKYPWIYSPGKDRPTPGVYDLKVIERLVGLGKNHRKYTGFPERSEFLDLLDGMNSDVDVNSRSNEIVEYITKLFNAATPEVWKHYNEVEWPFMRALYSLSGRGLFTDHGRVSQIFTLSERARNVLVESLRRQGIDTPDSDSLIKYVESNYGPGEKFAVSRAIKRSDYKGFKETDPLCANMHKIEKIERGVSVCKALLQQPNGFIPDYQIVGSDTVRCTSRNPNLLGLPKELRPVIQASSGCGIVECDYGQMEVGVLAALAEDAQLIADYNSGDVYQCFAEQLGLDRDQAKLLFLSILYGVSNRTLMLWLGYTAADTENLIQQFFQRYPVVATYQQELIRQGQTEGYVATESGLRRWVNYQAYQAASNREELASWQSNWFKNYPVQAGAAIIFKTAIIDIAANLPFDGFKLIAPMYDSIAFEAPLDRIDACTNLVCSAMERAMKELFPVLSPRVTVNNHDMTCWNAGAGVPHYQQWLDDIISDSNITASFIMPTGDQSAMQPPF